MVKNLDEGYLEEFAAHGTVNIFRIEVAAPGEECECWEPEG